MKNRPMVSFAAAVAATGLTAIFSHAQSDVQPVASPALEEITIIGDAGDVAQTTGAAFVIDEVNLERFEYADIQRIVRQVPGVAVQLEDGYGLRPNISIRGTATERSGRITLLEDNVLIAPAPYSAPSAYYFPTAGRMRQVEVLKGSASVRQGPYTVGGAMNFLSTEIPDQRGGHANLEVGSNETTRLHAHYGDSQQRYGWLVETHLWDSAGFQDIDLAGGDTGLDKDDFMAKFRVNSAPDAAVYQQLDIKLQYATEDSDQTYMGLTDADFRNRPERRYAASQLDNMDTDHEQFVLRYRADFKSGLSLSATAYENRFSRNWFKTEGYDADGSANAQDFSRTSWFNVVQAVNSGTAAGGVSAAQLQAVLDGGDTAPGSIQLRSNDRDYLSRGIQFGLDYDWSFGNTQHELEVGLRLHEDEEDRLQRNSTYRMQNGALVLDDLGLLGNAGNQLQEAEALSMHVYDRIAWNDWVFTPGLRYEDIDQRQTRWETRPDQTADPASRTADNLRDTRENNIGVWIPGVGALYSFTDSLAFYGGVHKGFTAPSNVPGVNEEESVNYELGMRYYGDALSVDAALFLTDYDNLLGECTASSGVADCEPGDAFNGDAATIAGLELLLNYELVRGAGFSVPLTLSYTYIDAEFDSDVADTEFFGDVSRGDPLPYIPANQFLLSLGLEQSRWATYLNVNYVDETCVRAACGPFERTDALTIVDVASSFRYSDTISFYARIDNLLDEDGIVGRQPYGARPAMERTFALGARVGL